MKVHKMPNNLPLNWCECKLETVCALDNGLKQNDLNLPLLDAKYLRGKKEAEYRQDGVVLNPKDYVILVDGENSGEIFSIYETGIMGSTFKKLSFSEFCSIPYTLFFIKSKQDLFRTNKKGAAIPHLDKTLFKNLMLPLPPLAEQKRIVKKIEALFQDIDEGVELLKSAQAQIKQYCQSVLSAAFSGKLYKTTEWKEVQLGDAITKLCNGTSKKQNKNATGIPVTRIETISDSTINFNRVGYISDFSQEDIDAYKLVDGDILFSNINSDFHLGKTAIYYGNKLLLHGMNLLLIRLNKENVFPSFINNYLNYCRFAGKFIKIAQHAVNQSSINQSKLRSFPIPLPTLPEQQRIVEEIEKRFTVADELEKAVNEGLEKADKLKQSILKKAFEGKLVPQDPNDEPASVLLERIKKSQTPTKGKKK